MSFAKSQSNTASNLELPGMGSPIAQAPVSAKKYSPPKNFSDEQNEIIHCPSPFVVAQAFAGTGKSTTGIGFAMHHAKKRVLVLCYNAANSIEANHKYSPLNKAGLTNATVATTHALARRYLDPKLNDRVATRWSAVTLRTELGFIGARADMRTASITANILRDFFSSVEPTVDPYLHGKTAREQNKASDELIAQCCEYAQKLWIAMNSVDKPSFVNVAVSANPISIPHDAYLKRFVLQNAQLDFDAVIFDEAQDANPIMIKLIENFRKNGKHVLMLGDQHQSIYEFRGAVNAMLNLPSEARVLPLTQSWRFGARTAALANLILHELKGEKIKIQGLGRDDYFKSDRGDALTYLSRTNADLIQRAVSKEGIGVHWVGGIERYRVPILEDVLRLKRGKTHEIQDVFLKKNFHSWSQFCDAAEHDREIKILHKLIEQYDREIPTLVAKLYANAVSDSSAAETRLSTVHNAKGLEWDFVKICDDFHRGPIIQAEKWRQGEQESFPEQEINLLYVGVTRSCLGTIPNKEIETWAENLESYRSKRVRCITDSPETWDEKKIDVAGNQTGEENVNPKKSPFAKVGTFRPGG